MDQRAQEAWLSLLLGLRSHKAARAAGSDRARLSMNRTPFSAKENVLLPETYNVVKQACPPGSAMGKRKGADKQVRPRLRRGTPSAARPGFAQCRAPVSTETSMHAGQHGTGLTFVTCDGVRVATDAHTARPCHSEKGAHALRRKRGPQHGRGAAAPSAQEPRRGAGQGPAGSQPGREHQRRQARCCEAALCNRALL